MSVVTGMGAVTPAGVGVAVMWERVRMGRPCGGPVTRFDASNFRSRICAACDEFPSTMASVSDDPLSRQSRCTQLGLMAASEALSHAAVYRGTLSDPARGGVVVGTAIGGVDVMENAFRSEVSGISGRNVRFRPDINMSGVHDGFHANSLSSAIASFAGFTGPCLTMATGCTAGLDAIGAADLMIRSGMADIVITGGVDAPLTPIVLASFDVIKAVTRRNEHPTRASRPFDANRDGFLLAEGAGVIVLEEVAHAQSRGRRPLAVIAGFASSSNAYHMTGLPSDGTRLAATISSAMDRARMVPGDIDYINAHGSSTKQNDQNETSAYKHVFGHRAYDVPISSTKSVLGHSLGAASAIETIVCVLGLQEAVVPPTANYEQPCEECDLDYVPNTPRPERLRHVLNNASGFSGIHSALVLTAT